MKRRTYVISLIVALILASIPIQPVSAAPKDATGLAVPVAGVVSGTLNGVLTGTANITGFAVQNGQLVAVGTLVGVIKDAAGNVLQSVVATFATAIGAGSTAACEILHLELGPIDLNLLGLVIHTNQIVLDITAVPGPGNLLGNLLCSVAHLLDGTNLNHLADVLNQILGAL
jgi:hypothetical protein